MASWRDKILREFTPQVARLTLVADPDGLLLEEGVLQGIREKGFELIPFEDHVAFRYAYESKYRSRWDRGELTDLVVVLRAPTASLDSLPYDLLEAGRQLSFNLGELFPNLSYAVLDELDRSDLDALYLAQEQHSPGKLGDNATKDFVLRHVFEIAPELIKQPPDLLRVLLRRHYTGLRLPSILDERLISVLHQAGRFTGWPLERVVPDRLAFFAFLQERWPVFLERLAAGDQASVGEEGEAYGFEIEGPSDVPFGHDDVRVYIDDLFLEGMLQPVNHEKSNLLAAKWVAVGIVTSPEADRARRLEGLTATIEASIPSADARYHDWLSFASKWAELTALRLELASTVSQELTDRLRRAQEQVDRVFTTWIETRYHTLHNQPPCPPVMVHHVPWSLVEAAGEPGDHKVALVVVDGLSLDQWATLRGILLAQRPNIVARESSVFAWVPTLTSVSRQSIFAGKPPLFFPKTISTTSREAAHWTRFWADRGLATGEVLYLRGVGDGSLRELEETASQPDVRVLGLVVDKVDKIMHGMELGAAGMHNQVRQWAEQEFFAHLLDLLNGLGFRVFLTSDHGNVEARGCGRPSEGAVAEQRGERVRIYSDRLLRERVKSDFPDATEWPPIGLPEDFIALTAPGRSAFIPLGRTTVAHGGATLEEVVVPFVSFEWREH